VGSDTSPPTGESLAASLLLPAVGLDWASLVGVLGSIPRTSFLAANPSPFLLELPSQLGELNLLGPSMQNRREFVEQRLAKLSAADLGDARVFYLAPRSEHAALRVGRANDVDVRLDSKTVSKRHAELLRDRSGRWRVRDLEAVNGTYIEGRRMPAGATLPLRSGNVLRFSSYRAMFLDPEDTYRLIGSGSEAPPELDALLEPTPAGRRLRDVLPFLRDPTVTPDLSPSAFLLQVPLEVQRAQDVIAEELSAELPIDATRTISASRILRLRRSRRVGEARLHVVVPSSEGVTLGRSAEHADLVLPELGVSKAHARILHGERGWSIVDLGSKNGTLLEKKPIRAGLALPLRPGQGVFFSNYRTLFLDLALMLELARKVK